MWLFTKIGFFSAVEHKERRGIIIVRSRDRSHLDALKQLCPDLKAFKIAVTPSADYGFRILMPKAYWQFAAKSLATCVDYPNFKDQVPDDVIDHQSLMQVWRIMRNGTDGRAVTFDALQAGLDDEHRVRESVGRLKVSTKKTRRSRRK